MKKAEIPKVNVMSSYDKIAPMEPHIFVNILLEFNHSPVRRLSNRLWSACPVKRKETIAMSKYPAIKKRINPRRKSVFSLFKMS